MDITMNLLPGIYSVIQIEDVTKIDFQKLKGSFYNLCVTDDEISLLLNQKFSDETENKINEEKGFKCMKINGVLDFGEIGIIAKISTVLAKAEISVFVVSTYNTDYVLVKENKIAHAIDVLNENKIVVSKIINPVFV